MISIDKRSTNSILYTKPSLIKRQGKYKSTSPQYSESFISNISRTETDSFNKDSIYSNDRFDSSSNITIEYRKRNNLVSSDIIQSSANFIYPNIRIISSGYFINNEKNSIYVFSNKLSANKNIPLVYLGSEYFFRKSIDFENLKYPLSTIENLEPLIDLFLNRPQFIKEIPELNDFENYRLLPQSISGLIFFNSSIRHLCSENKTNFTIKDLLNMSQRENNIIQINALNDKRYHGLINQLTEIFTN